jgi:KaiC/GvpD/RAD55 family RecA-like ATPase
MEDKDLFREFNENKAARKYETVLVLGPPRSGKTLFINKYLNLQKAEEYTIGLIGKKHVQPSNKIIDIFKRVMPWVSKLNYITIEEDKRLKKFGNEFVQSLKEMLGDKAPQHIINEIIERAKESNTNSIITYYIPWDYTGKIDEETKEALDLIIKTFNNHKAKIKWIKAEYIPPGLVREVAELIMTKGMKEAEEIVKDWVDAYITVLKIFGLDKGEWEESFVTSARTFFGTLGVKGLEYITSNIILGAVATTIITLLTFHAFKTSQRAGAGDIIMLTAKLAKLKAPKSSNEPCGEFNELGKLIVYKLATALGLNVEEVCDALTEITVDKDRLRSIVEDINKRITEVEEKVKILEKSLGMFKQEVRAGIKIVNRDEFGRRLLYPNIEVEEGELRIKVDIGSGHYRVVEEGALKTALEIITDKLKNGGTVVLTGPRGIGKSTLSALAIWRLLDAGEVGLVVRVNELVDKDKIYFFDAFIDNYLKEFRNIFGKLLILYDPSSTEMYSEEGEVSVPARIIDTIKNLLKIVNCIKDSPALIILPSDIYNALSEEMKKSLEQYEFKVKLSDIKFLSEIIREYSGKCKDKLNENELNELASKVVEYEEGYTLIARLVGMELTKSNCNIDDIKRMIEKPEHKASPFIADFINKWFNVIDDKGQVNIKRINALAEILAIRRPFTKSHNPGDPILTKGIVRLIERVNGSEELMSDEMINWLIRRSHDLVENTIERLLDGEDLGEVSEPWRSISTNMPKITMNYEAVKYFIEKYGEEFFEELKHFSGCWKKAALIMGSILTMHLKLPDKETYNNSAVVDVLNYCDIDDYLLVDNEIPIFVKMLVTSLYISGSSPFTRIFANKYENAIEEAKKLLETWRRRPNEFEAYYALGIASIVAEAARLGKAINEDDADAILKAALTAVPLTFHPIYVKHILEALEPLRDKAPQQYLGIIAVASQMKLDKDTARLIYSELKYILSNFFNKLSKLVWPLMTAVQVCSNILRRRMHSTKEEVENIVKSMCDLLNALKKESNELATIAETYTLIPVLEYSKSRDFISKYCSVNDPVARAVEVHESLKELANKSDELLKNKHFMNWATFMPWISQQNIKELITDIEAHLTFSLAEYKLYNGALGEASKLFNETAEAFESIGDWESYINARNWFLRAEVIKARSINECVNLANDFEKLWNETLEKLEPIGEDLEIASAVLNKYLAYLASIGRYDDTEKILSMYGVLLNYDKEAPVLTRLMLRLLGFTKVAEVKPEELIDAYKDDIFSPFLPALKLTLDIEASIEECEALKYRNICIYAFLAVKGNNDALTKLKSPLNDLLDVKLREFVQRLDGKALVQLLAPMIPRCRFALMLYALVNGNIELAKKHAQWGSEEYRLVGKLFGDVYGACCDVSSEGFKLALLKLYHNI